MGPILELIFLTLTEKSFVVTNDSQAALVLPTPLEIAVWTHFLAQHGTKTTPIFLSADGEASYYYLQVSSPYYQAAQCNEKTPI